MYELRCRSAERPWASRPDPRAVPPDPGTPQPLVLHMRENRSHLGPDARACFSVIGLLLLVTSIGPALHGHWLVPAFSIAALAGLTFALDRHGASRPAQETLELGEGRVRHHDSTGRATELPVWTLRLAAEGRSPGELRLFLRGREGTIEFGRCLSLAERRAVAPLVAAALAQSRRT